PSARARQLLTLSLRLPPPPNSTLFPYTTLFRSGRGHDVAAAGQVLAEIALAAAPVHEAVAVQDQRKRPLGHRRIGGRPALLASRDRKSTRLNSSHVAISYAVFCLKKKSETRARR